MSEIFTMKISMMKSTNPVKLRNSESISFTSSMKMVQPISRIKDEYVRIALTERIRETLSYSSQLANQR